MARLHHAELSFQPLAFAGNSSAARGNNHAANALGEQPRRHVQPKASKSEWQSGLPLPSSIGYAMQPTVPRSSCRYGKQLYEQIENVPVLSLGSSA